MVDMNNDVRKLLKWYYKERIIVVVFRCMAIDRRIKRRNKPRHSGLQMQRPVAGSQSRLFSS